MSDHLPECPVSLPRGNSNDLCICDRLRACEQRSFQAGREYQQKRLTNHGMHSGLACLTNYQAGIQAARDAVAAVAVRDLRDKIGTDALAAIDALRGDA